MVEAFCSVAMRCHGGLLSYNDLGNPNLLYWSNKRHYAVLGISSVVALVHLIRVVSEGEQAALLVLVGVMIVVATAISDVLKANDLHELPYMVGYGLGLSYWFKVIFWRSDSQMPKRRWSRLFRSQRKRVNSRANSLRTCRMSYERRSMQSSIFLDPSFSILATKTYGYARAVTQSSKMMASLIRMRRPRTVRNVADTCKGN